MVGHEAKLVASTEASTGAGTEAGTKASTQAGTKAGTEVVIEADTKSGTQALVIFIEGSLTYPLLYSWGVKTYNLYGVR